MKIGTTYRGFIVKHLYHVDEIGVKVIDLIHEKSGAHIVHIVSDDDENMFAIACKTYPNNDSGTPHILEHVVLCGSKKYPVQDPFLAVTKRSLNTFMNAFTAKLWTAYPAASKIEKDFTNLLEVYLDAVFHPRIDKMSFLQEGHRLEFAEPDNPSSELTIKGIVYNEMKGAYANPSSTFWRRMMQGLCKDHPYGFDSGGDPQDIPLLTYEELKHFHHEFYHPSRVIFCFYGNIPTEKHLDFLGEKLLDHAEKKSPIPPAPLIKRFTAPVREEIAYPISEEDTQKKTFIGFSYLTTLIKDSDETLALTLLDSILMDTDASLLKHKLISSGLCVNADSLLDTDAREIPYSITLRGCEKENRQAIEELLNKSLREIVHNKIPHELIESSLHQLEFSRSEISGDYGPYGLELFGRTVLPFLQGGSLTEGLHIHTIFDRLRNLLKDKNYLPSLIEKHLLNNPHMYSLVMAPDPTLGSKLHQEEKDMLEKKKKSLTSAQVKAILDETKEMEEYREEKEDEDLSCLPLLELKDIPKEVSYFPLLKASHENLVVYHHETFTNKITYATLVFDLPQIDEIDLPYLRLFASLLTELGAGGRNYLSNLQTIHENLGGVWTSLSLNVQRENIQTCYPTISISAKALSRKNEEMFQILRDFILSPDLKDRERVKELISQSYTNLQNRLNSSAVHYALKESAASVSPWSHINNIWHGFPNYKFIEQLHQNIDSQIDTVMEKFATLSKAIFHLNNPHLVLCCDGQDWKELERHKFYGIAHLADASTSYQPWIDLAKPAAAHHSARTIATPIAHNAQSISTVTMQSPQAPALKIASYLLDNIFVHRDVREKGGAYTSGVKYNILTGIYQFFSSRDPNIATTYKAFIDAAESVIKGDFSDLDLHEAKLSYIQDVDGIVVPGSRATVTYFQLKVGLTKEIRQEFRKKLLAVTKEDLIAAMRERLKPSMKEKSIRVTYSSKELLEKQDPFFVKYKLPLLVRN